MYDIEKGHTKIANDLLEDICKLPLSGAGLRILFWAIRNSYGFNRKHTRPASIREISEAIRLPSKGTTHAAIFALMDSGILFRTEKNEYKIIKEKVFTVLKTERPFLKQNVLKTERSVLKTERSVLKTERSECNIGKDNLKDNLKDKGRGGERPTPPAPGPSDVKKEGRVLETKIMTVAGAYADAKNIKLEAREVYLKTRKVYFTAKDLLALCQGNVKRAIAAIIDHAAHYKRNQKPDWKFEWILEDFYIWEQARIQNEEEK